jgi:hypothetical protein
MQLELAVILHNQHVRCSSPSRQCPPCAYSVFAPSGRLHVCGSTCTIPGTMAGVSTCPLSSFFLTEASPIQLLELVSTSGLVSCSVRPQVHIICKGCSADASSRYAWLACRMLSRTCGKLG